jgi:hypothetical protein
MKRPKRIPHATTEHFYFQQKIVTFVADEYTTTIAKLLSQNALRLAYNRA